MGFECGIVGLPNVGKSTLFNALPDGQRPRPPTTRSARSSRTSAWSRVPDPRLDELAAIVGPAARSSRRSSTFVDIAGLVRGASKGEGLGNKFLVAHPRGGRDPVRLRCFEDGDITHVENRIDPIRRHRHDRDRADAGGPGKLRKAPPGGRKEGQGRRQGSQATVAAAGAGPATAARRKPRARSRTRRRTSSRPARRSKLLTAKPVDVRLQRRRGVRRQRQRTLAKVEARAKAEGAACVVISAKIEAEIAGLPTEDAASS